MTRQRNSRTLNVPDSSIRPRFPPNIDVQQLINESIKKHEESQTRRTPNAFLLYRSQYIAEFGRVNNRNLAATRISTLAKNAWNDEPINVKIFYKQIASEIKKGVKKKIPYSFVNEKKNLKSPNTNDGLNVPFGVTDIETYTADPTPNIENTSNLFQIGTENTNTLNLLQIDDVVNQNCLNLFQMNNEIIDSTPILDSNTINETNCDFFQNTIEITPVDYTSMLQFYPTINNMPVFLNEYSYQNFYDFQPLNDEFFQSYFSYYVDYSQEL
ncbi:19423_t:CDS:1 [Gigaspora margarita]|uniref:MATA-HMG n=2 Tax=Gigaspora margarita TaxID=4874 RepID=A0A8H3XCP8_GIGMA|nr:MATA-HMG [Gigaspora margarita]CAG8564164.1 19423_t:CDS:1 [Gigaspora margarita]